MNLESWAGTHPGSFKFTNEDSYICDDNCSCYMVADGLGSYDGADVASLLTCQTIHQSIQSLEKKDLPQTKAYLPKLLTQAIQVLKDKVVEQPKYHHMATTLTLLWLVEGNYFIANIGDSRAYILRDGSFSQITMDHSLAFEQFMMGAISKEEVNTHPNQKLLTRTISARNDFVIPDLFSSPLKSGDIILLCTDGLNKEVEDPKIAEILGQKKSLSIIGESLIAQAMQNGASDNITVTIIRVEPDA